MTDRVIVWGMGKDFSSIYNLLKLNEESKNIEIVAYISKDIGFKKFEDKEIIDMEQIALGGAYFDYIIVATSRYYSDIVAYGENILGIEKRKFINGKIFKIPCFSWKKYKQIYESKVSIVADWCYGGVLSNALGLGFNSPFVNVRVGVNKGDYVKLLEKLDYYMSVAPKWDNTGEYNEKNWSGFEGRLDYPKLWYDDILIHGFHYNSQKEFYNKWEERRKRYNKYQKLIMQVLYDDNDLDKFRALKFKNKLGFYGREVEDRDIVYIDLKDVRNYHFAETVNTYINSGNIYRDIDIFKLIAGEASFRRF